MPTRELILKIAALAGDERGDPMVREIAYAKLAALKDAYPHLSWAPPGEDAPTAPPEPGAPPWADVATNVDDALHRRRRAMGRGPGSWTSGIGTPPPRAIRALWSRPRASSAAWFCFATSGRRTQWGFLLVNTRTDAPTFSERRYPTEIAAHEAAWEALNP